MARVCFGERRARFGSGNAVFFDLRLTCQPSTEALPVAVGDGQTDCSRSRQQFFEEENYIESEILVG